jgi:hypothetical protein
LDANVKVIHTQWANNIKVEGEQSTQERILSNPHQLLKVTTAKNSRRCKMQMIMQRCRG